MDEAWNLVLEQESRRTITVRGQEPQPLTSSTRYRQVVRPPIYLEKHLNGTTNYQPRCASFTSFAASRRKFCMLAEAVAAVERIAAEGRIPMITLKGAAHWPGSKASSGRSHVLPLAWIQGRITTMQVDGTPRSVTLGAPPPFASLPRRLPIAIAEAQPRRIPL
jgi:hypothetical protein